MGHSRVHGPQTAVDYLRSYFHSTGSQMFACYPLNIRHRPIPYRESGNRLCSNSPDFVQDFRPQRLSRTYRQTHVSASLNNQLHPERYAKGRLRMRTDPNSASSSPAPLAVYVWRAYLVDRCFSSVLPLSAMQETPVRFP